MGLDKSGLSRLDVGWSEDVIASMWGERSVLGLCCLGYFWTSSTSDGRACALNEDAQGYNVRVLGLVFLKNFGCFVVPRSQHYVDGL